MPDQALDIEFPASANGEALYLVLDVEATGLPVNPGAQAGDYGNWPRILQIAWLVFDEEGGLISRHNRYIINEIPIPRSSTQIHGIDNPMLAEKGEEATVVWNDFLKDLNSCQYIIGHNVDFDLS